MENKIELSVNLVNALLGYLVQRPYVEVKQFIDEIQKEAINQSGPENGSS